MRLRTTLYLASFFPIFISALFIAYLFTVHLTVVVPGGGRAGVPATGAMIMAIFALVVGWCFYRSGLRLVRQVDVLEHMTDQVKRGDLKATARVPAGKGEVAVIADVFRQMVVELRGYVELIRAHEKLKAECDAALASAERLRASSVQVSGVLELLQRAEQGSITRLLDDETFLLGWLPCGTLVAALGLASGSHGREDGIPSIPPEVVEVFRRLIAGHSGPAQGEGPETQAGPPDTVSLADALKDAVVLCQWKWGRERPQAPMTVDIYEGPPGSLDVVARRMDLVQAFAAVLTNAAEAMPDGGAVSIDARSDTSGVRSVSITDKGVGMSTAVQARCMKPFFSTKEGRLGVGLNLAGRLVMRCGGRLGAIGEKGMGVTVHMTFQKPSKPEKGKGTAETQRGPLRILLVDDDEPARDALLAMLAKQGHHAIGVEDGSAAILRLRKQRFDVVMTDLAMPIMSGEELAMAVKARYPGTPVVLVSGAGEELDRRHLMPEGVDLILPKPVLSFDLALALSRAMERVKPDAGSVDDEGAG